jgi:LysM repeat protein
MASRSRHSSRSDRDSDSMEAIKPLVVLVLFGTILYGAYSVVQKGPSSPTPQAVSDAPAFTPPTVDIAAGPPPAAPVSPTAPATTGPIPLAAGVVTPPMPPAAVATAASPLAGPAATAQPGTVSPSALPALPVPTMPTAPPPSMPPATAATAGDATSPASSGTTYLNAQSAPPPVADAIAAASLPAVDAIDRPDRYATLATTPPVSAGLLPPGAQPPAPSAPQSSAAFTTAWADAHEKLAAGRYAEALAALSIWHDDPSLGLEESQRLEDLLGQLAGTVIYSQQDLLMPPHVVAAGETLPTLAMPLGVSWQLLGKINGVSNPQDLVPGEHLKVLRGPFDAVVSVSRRRVSLQLGGYYAGSFPIVVGRTFLARVGTSIPVAEVRRGPDRSSLAATAVPADPSAKPAIVLADGLLIEAAEDPGMASDASSSSSLIVSVRDFTELLDILGPGSKVLIRQ